MISYWVDGSNKNDKVFSFGCATVLEDGTVEEANKAYEGHEYCQYRNVAGECFGALYAISDALKRNETEITIYHDYIGIQKWGEGQWKANNPLSQMYKNQVGAVIQSGMKIHFIKVKAHTGVEYNELADQLAKQAIENLKTKGEM